MGRRGPPPKPTKLKLVEGNPGCRPLNKLEPEPAAKMPRCPAWLDPVARAEWRRVAPELFRIGVLTVVDGNALATWAATVSDYRRARQLAKDAPDDTARVAAMRLAKELVVVLRPLAGELGLTPSGRCRIQIPKKPDKSGFEFPAELRDEAEKRR